MYYQTKRNNTQTRLVGLATVGAVVAGCGIAVLNGFGTFIFVKPPESEVVMIEEQEVVDEDEIPPPPIDVELPPPPPMAVLPEFVIAAPPAAPVAPPPAPPAPPPVKAAPPPPPTITLKSRPKPGRRFEKPEYPAAALRAGEEGNVVVSVCVAVDGRMSNVQLVKSSGFPRLDEAALKGLARTRLDPAVGSDGKPIEMCDPPYQFTFEWNLEDAKK